MKRLNNILLPIIAAALAFGLSACNDANSNEGAAMPVVDVAAPAPTPAPAQPAQAAKPVAVCAACGTVKTITPVSVRPEGSGLGAALGGIVGGLAGSQVGGGSGKKIATVAGVIGGAVAGNNIERNRNVDRYYEIGVAMDNGDFRNVKLDDASGLSVGALVTVDAGNVHLR